MHRVIAAVLIFAGSASAQQVGERHRAPHRSVEIVAIDSLVRYRVLESEASPSTVGRTYSSSLASFRANFVLTDSVVPAPPPTPDPAPIPSTSFVSNWATLGNTAAAKTDGGIWNILSDPGNALAVVDGAPLGFPTPHVLRVTAVEASQGYGRLAKTGLPVPADGQSVFYRWYYRNEIGRTADNSTHPIESGQTGGLDWSFNVEVQTDSTWYPEFRPGGNQMDATRARWTGPALRRGVVYRVELQVQKLNANEFRAHFRVYQNDVLIASDADFNNYRAGLFPATRMSLADSPTLRFASVGGLNLGEIRAGNNGLATSGYGSALFAYQGGFAVCADWCGAYR
jgi:hypothetical protein